MITFDGERSKKRKWFAEKRINIIRAIDVPASAIEWEGFRFRAWQDGELSGGRVTAPMGIAITRTLYEHVDFAVAESYQAGFISSAQVYSLTYSGAGQSDTVIRLKGASADELTPLGIGTIPHYLSLAGTFIGTDQYQNITVDTEQFVDESCRPVLIPLGEAIWHTISSRILQDTNADSVWDNNDLFVTENQLLFYSANGSSLNGRTCWSVLADSPLSLGVRFIFSAPLLNGLRQIECRSRVFSESDGVPVLNRVFSASPTGVTVQNSLASDNWLSVDPEDPPNPARRLLPAGLRTLLLDVENLNGNAQPLCQYAFSLGQSEPVQFLHVVDVSDWPDDTSDIAQWFRDNPGNDEWKMFITFHDGNYPYNIDLSQFESLLDSKTSWTVTGDHEKAVMMMNQFCCWPNHNFMAPYDGAMFHSAAGDVYAWTRYFGSVKFNKDGMSNTALYLPTEVTGTTGVRPVISWAGGDYYVCVCERVKEKIDAVYYGNPWASGEWTKIPDPVLNEVTLEMKYARPINVSATDVTILAIVVDGTRYRAAVYTKAAWNFLAPLPFTIDANNYFDMTFFGDGVFADYLKNHPDPPNCVSYSPCTGKDDYSKYSTQLPPL